MKRDNKCVEVLKRLKTAVEIQHFINCHPNECQHLLDEIARLEHKIKKLKKKVAAYENQTPTSTAPNSVCSYH